MAGESQEHREAHVIAMEVSALLVITRHDTVTALVLGVMRITVLTFCAGRDLREPKIALLSIKI